MIWVDLHVHSTASDGTTEPSQLPDVVLETMRKHERKEPVERYVLALTDHDTLAGITKLKAAAEGREEFSIIPGVEISCDYKGRNIHMLGLGIDENNRALQECLEYYRSCRDTRNEKILARFEEIGIHIPMDEIAVAEGESMGRPHIARYLLDHGLISSINEAFDLYMTKGKPCYVDREKADIFEAVELILQAGGCPVLAHPLQYKRMTREELEEMIRRLKEKGLRGIETYYTEFSQAEVAYLEELSLKYDLIRTGGSDYHGDNKPKVEIGFGWGNLGDTMEKMRDIEQQILGKSIV